MAPTVSAALAEARVVALLGPRQAGKSTLARRVAATGDREAVSLDDPATLASARADPGSFVSRLAHGTVIDEIQRVPDLLLAIKHRVDRDDTPGQFLLTGSANLRRLPRVADALPGRVDYLTLWPLTQQELADRSDRLLGNLINGDVPDTEPTDRDDMIARLLAGGFPEAQRRSESGRPRFLRSYLDAIVDRDLADVGSVQHPDAIAALLRLIAARSGALAQYERLGAELGLDGKTAKTYVETLERLFLVRVRRAWTRNLGKRQVRSPKLYIADSGLFAALLGASADRLRSDGGLLGAMLETFVTTELERQESWAADPMSLWHFRERDDEVDVVAEAPSGEVVGIEVKATGLVRPSDLRGLKRLRDGVGASFRCGCVLYLGERVLPFGDRLWAVPLSALWSPG